MPLPAISIAQMREWEAATWATGQTEAEVIRRVGKNVAQLAMRLTRAGDLILILVGKGNNGADARSTREHLPERRVDLLEATNPTADLSKLNALLALHPALIIDGLFGIGINRPLSNDWIKFIDCVNDAQTEVLAVDVPSGLNGDTGEPQGAAIRASNTLTVGAPKIGMLQQVAWPYVGRLEITSEVGLIPCPLKAEVNWTLAEDFRGYPPQRLVATHKGTYGHLAILAGSVGFHGAAVLAARGAQRAQPGLITLFTLPEAYPAVAAQLQAVMVSPWRPDIDLAARYQAIVMGPGLAAPEAAEQLKSIVQQLWRHAQMPVIVDASALDWLSLESTPGNFLRVVTPHPGEAARLLRCSPKEVLANRVQAVRTLSAKLGNAWIVVKGHQTLIGKSSEEIYVNSSGNPHLAQGGSGDVLSGYLGGLLVQSELQAEPLKAIRYAVWQHGATADFLQATRPNWAIEDLMDALGNQSAATPASPSK